MILVDTSVWVDHLRRSDPGLVDMLERSAVLIHPFVVGELACGSLRDRGQILELLQQLPAAVVAHDDEVLHFIDQHALHGQGIGLKRASVLGGWQRVGACCVAMAAWRVRELRAVGFLGVAVDFIVFIQQIRLNSSRHHRTHSRPIN